MESASLTSLSNPPQLDSIAPPPLSEQKKPGVAFLLSLLYPGAGHFYCGKTQIGMVTAAFFTGATAVVFLVSPQESERFWGVALRAAIVLYGYAFFDAYYTAREINAGISDYLIGGNPRIAAVLNLLTAGFGYFYLGERGKGIAWFFVSRIVGGAAATRSPWVGVLVELACIVVAVDAYRIARRQMRELLPAELTDTFSQSHEGLSPALPLALGGILFCNYSLLIAIGVLLPDYTKLDRSQVSIADSGTGRKVFSNPKYNVRIELPHGWEILSDSPEFVFRAANPEYGCQIG